MKPMNLEQLNKEHFLERDIYNSVIQGMSSSLVDYRNGIMYINVFVGRKWKKSYTITAYEVAHQWRDNFPELNMSIGCKVFIVSVLDQPGVKSYFDMKIKSSYSAKKGILFGQNQLN